MLRKCIRIIKISQSLIYLDMSIISILYSNLIDKGLLMAEGEEWRQ